MKTSKQSISIGVVAARTGLAVSAIRFYEEGDLVFPGRDTSGRRVFAASDIRRLSFIIIAQKLGFTLSEIRDQLTSLPQNRTPTLKDWEKISRNFNTVISERIAGLTRLQENLSGCIGCGCLSLKKCRLYNADDVVARKGAGPRYLMGDKPESGAGGRN